MNIFRVVQVERERLRKEKQLLDEALREKEDMERKVRQMQEDVRLAQENLVSDARTLPDDMYGISCIF